jgi:hypothetical protein
MTEFSPGLNTVGTGSGLATEATALAILAATGGAGYSSRLDEGATYTYVGLAAAGSTDASASWQIKRYDSATFSNGMYANGVTTFNQVWTNRASLSYS